MKADFTSKQMKDARVAGWVVQKLSFARAMQDKIQVRCLSRAFDPGNIIRWLNSSNPNMGRRLLQELPDKVLRPVVPEMLQRWGKMADPVAGQAALRLARLAPDRVAPLLKYCMAKHPLSSQSIRLWGAVQAASRMGPAGAEILRQLLLRVELSKSGALLAGLGVNVAAVRLRMPEAPALAAATVHHFGPGFGDLDMMLTDLYSELAPGMPFLGILYDREHRKCGYFFEDLPELFVDDAPIAELDQLAESARLGHLDSVVKALRMDGPMPELATFAARLVRLLSGNLDQHARCTVYLFVLAAAAAQYARLKFDFEQCEFSFLLDLLTSDVAELHCELELIDAAVHCFTEADIPRVQQELRSAHNYQGAVRLLSLIQRLGCDEFLEPLVDALGCEMDEVAVHDAARVLVRTYGRSALDMVVRKWTEFDDVQKYVAIDVVAGSTRYAAAKALLELLPHALDDNEDAELWGEMAYALASPRLIPGLQQLAAKGISQAEEALEAIRLFAEDDAEEAAGACAG